MSRQERIEDLRRRVVEDPASIAFAQLAEEYRRAGDCQAAVDTCRAGLLIHPDYVSARVTLGRALTVLGLYDEARLALNGVLEAEPNNRGAIRGLGEWHRYRGNLAEALACFERAQALATYDAELERLAEEVRRAQLAARGDRIADVALDRGPTQRADTLTAEERAAPLVRVAETLAALEEWLSAIYVARTNRPA